MANYSTNLKQWGDQGTEYPNGHSQQDDVPPVDVWHDFLFYNQIEDIQHLINLTNDRLETDIGSSYVSAPEDGHLMYRTDTETFEVYDATNASWKDVAWGADFRSHKNSTTNPHSVTASQTGGVAKDGSIAMTGNLDVQNNKIVGGAAELDFDGTDGHVHFGNGTAGGGLRIDSHQHFPDGNYLYFGSSHDFGIHYDGANNEWVFTDESNGNQIASFPVSGKATFDNGLHTHGDAEFRSDTYHGEDPAEVITETTSPKSWEFLGTDKRDIHDKTDVTISNGSTASATEDVTVELYQGIDTTGSLLRSETISVTVAAGGTSTVTFIGGDTELTEVSTNNDYHIEVTTSGTTLAIDQTDEYTRGGRYQIQDDDVGDFKISNQFGTNLLEIDAINENITNIANFNTTINANGGVSVNGNESWHDGNVTGGTDINVSATGIDHADTSTQGNVSSAAGAAITDINVDGRGHVTSLGTTDFDGRFYNEGQDLTGTNRVGGGNGFYLDFNNSTNWAELVDGSGTRTDLVLGDIYINDGVGWLAGNIATSSAGYDIQKNGTDGSGVINFKT